MNCELVQSRLAALLDGELRADAAAETERHLADCPGCSQSRAELLAVKEMAAVWDVDAPDIITHVMQAIFADEQCLLLAEIQLMRAEMEVLRAEMEALRRQLPPRPETPWMLPGRFDSPKDYSRMENDPWNLIRS